MMKISGIITSCCVALVLILTSVSAVRRRLDSIDDLREIDFGGSVPKHSILLLHWFANAIDIDDTGIRLTFNPNNGDYGSHHYGNYERLLEPVSSSYRYYTIGNLGSGTTRRLPSYVGHPPMGYEGRNRDRIIIRVIVWESRIDRVYITQHYGHAVQQGTRYDPEHTYEITTNLLRQIREFSVHNNNNQLVPLRDRYGEDIDDSQLNCIRNDWRDLACLGLLLSIVIPQMYYTNQSNPIDLHSNQQLSWNRDTDIETGISYQQRQDESWLCCNLRVCFAVFLVLLVLIWLYLHKISS